MITYFCHFGDGEVGEKFKKIFFGNIKLIPLLESKFKESESKNSEYIILIRYYIDGKITQFNDCKDNDTIVKKKKKIFVISRKISLENAVSMSLLETFNFILESTLEAIQVFENKFEIKNSLISFHDLNSIVNETFKEIYLNNL